MEPNRFVKSLKEYPLASHEAWESKNKKEVLKMDWNEADVLLPDSVKKAAIDFITNGPICWYPDIANQTLISSLARYSNVPEEYVQYFGGEDGALDYVVRTFLAPDDEVVIVGPTYDNFRVFVESVGAVPKNVVAEDIFTPNVDLLIKNISQNTKMVYLVNPNNPTGIVYSREDLEKLLNSFPNAVFIVDEAYFEFMGETSASLVEEYENIIVGRSLSKAFGVASFRFGYLITSPKNLVHINKIRNGKNISALAQIVAVEALKNSSYVDDYVKEVRKMRTLASKKLEAMGFAVKETPANFILVIVPDTKQFCESLRNKGVFVRNLSHLPSMNNYVRITIGGEKSTKHLLEIISNLLKNGDIKAK